jgi:hypothetical protein
VQLGPFAAELVVWNVGVGHEGSFLSSFRASGFGQ